jgi:putative DNA primase/helicase
MSHDQELMQREVDHAEEFSSVFPTVEYAANRAADENAWSEPQALTVKMGYVPYPLDELPAKIRAAVDEVQGFAKAPTAMIATSAIAALSLTIQAHVDIERAQGLHSPVGLFLMTIADSGERKSSIDGYFTKAIRDYETVQAEEAKPLMKDYTANLSAWEAKYSGIKDKIRLVAKDNKPTVNLENDLRNLIHEKPVPPIFPRLTYADATPESLAIALAQKWPSAGVVSAEAGIVFGSHGMGADSVTRNLAQMNQLWDGNILQVDRKTSDSFQVRGARVTMSLMIQEATLRSFYGKSGALARGTGFFARFFVSRPESTQGDRPYSEPPEHWPALSVFNRQITEILNQDAPVNKNGELEPLMMKLSPEAKSAWVFFYNEIESQLKIGGELYEVRDVASKVADNAARLAALFKVFEHGMSSMVCVECFVAASRIAAWHLYEARRFFAELALPMELANAARLDTWLVEHCRRVGVREVDKNYTRQHGTLRDTQLLNAAIDELRALDRIRISKVGRKSIIKVNPTLLVQP